MPVSEKKTLQFYISNCTYGIIECEMEIKNYY